mgnify:FL=1
MQVCTKCIAQFGFRLSDKSKSFETDEELYEHMENVHGMFVIREGETEEQAEARCAKKGIVADITICQCEECKILRGENSSIRVTDEIIAKRWIQPEI